MMFLVGLLGGVLSNLLYYDGLKVVKAQYAGILAGTAIIYGKKAIRYVNNFTIVETHIKPPTDQVKDDNKIKSKTH